MAQFTKKQVQEAINRHKMAEIKEWLTAHDYLINKHILGELSDDDKQWTDYLAERAKKIAEYNSYEN